MSIAGPPTPADEGGSSIQRELVARCIAGDEDAWARIVDECGGAVHRTLLGYLTNRGVPDARSAAEDLLCEAFASILENDSRALRQFQGRCSLTTWLCIIARSRAAQHLRRRRLDTVSPNGDGREIDGRALARLVASGQKDALASLERKEALHAVLEALEDLPAKLRVAVVMHAIGGRPYADIAKVLAVSENTVGSLISRGLARLREGVC